MKTFSGIYKGDRVVELFEDIDLPEDTAVLVVIPEQDDEWTLRKPASERCGNRFRKTLGQRGGRGLE